jgi:anti-sigma B factor antagonist
MAIYIVEKVIEGVMVVDVRGRITLGPETEALRSKLKQLIDSGQQRLILDLGEVTYIDSVGLSTLVASYTSARRAGGDLKLLRLPRGVHQLLQITRLSTVFEIYGSLDAARQAFGQEEI